MDVSKFDLSEYSMVLPTIEKLSYCKKLCGLDLKQCPFKTAKLYWTKTKEELKSLVKKCTRNDLIFYFVYEKVVVQVEVVENWKSLDSHVKFVNGYLREFSAMKISKGNVVVKGLVTHSMAYTKPPLNCWVALKQEGNVICGHCDCKAGLGGYCSHVGVLLWGVVNISEETVTSAIQQWHNKATTNHPDLPTEISSLQTAKRGSVVDKKFDPVSDESLQKMLFKLEKEERGVALHRLIEPFSQKCVPQLLKIPLPQRLTALFDQTKVALPITEIQSFCEDLIINYSVNIEQQSIIERITRNQATCKNWFKIREGRVTASKVYQVTRTSLHNPSKSLLQQVAYPMDSLFQSEATRWGIKHESIAINLLKELMNTNKLHQEFVVSENGLYISLSHGYLAATPDGISHCKCHGKAVIEVKCPFSHKDRTLEQAAIIDHNFCLCIDEDGILKLKRSHPYFYQVQQQMFVCEITKCFFCVYTSKDFGCFNIDYEDNFVTENIIPKSKLYILQVVLPELLSKYWSKTRYEKSSSKDKNEMLNVEVQESTIDQSGNVVNTVHVTRSQMCYCNGLVKIPTNNDSVINCANENCRAHLYHKFCLQALGKKRFNSNWECDPCKKIKRNASNLVKVNETNNKKPLKPRNT